MGTATQNPDTFLCAPSTVNTTNSLLKQRTLTFKFVSEPLKSIQAKEKPGLVPVAVASPFEIHEEKQEGWDTQDVAQQSMSDQGQSDLIKTFKLYINPSQSYYEHKTTIRRNPIHGAWPKTNQEDHDLVYFALRQNVPDDLAQKGLCDWQTGGQLSEDTQHMRTSEESAKYWHIQERMMRKRGRDLDPNTLVAWKSLDDMALQAALKDDGNNSVPKTAPMKNSHNPVPHDAPSGSSRGPAWTVRAQNPLNPLASYKHQWVSKKIPVTNQGVMYKSIPLDEAVEPDTQHNPLESFKHLWRGKNKESSSEPSARRLISAMQKETDNTPTNDAGS